jgi:hypothetical protein
MAKAKTSKSSAKPARKKPVFGVGSIVAIPLPDGRYAYAKAFKNVDWGVYDFISREMETVEKVTAHAFLFFQHCTIAPAKSGKWPVIGAQPFADEETSWGPPRTGGVLPGFPVDPLLLQIRHKGVGRRATLAEAAGLDIGTVCQSAEQFIEVLQDRLVRGKHDQYRIKA